MIKSTLRLPEMDSLILQRIASFLSLEDTLTYRFTCSCIQEKMTSITTINSSSMSISVVTLVYYLFCSGQYFRKTSWYTNHSDLEMIRSDCSANIVAYNIKTPHRPIRYLNFEFLENLNICFDQESFSKCGQKFVTILSMGMLENLRKLRISWSNCPLSNELESIIFHIFSGINLSQLKELKLRGITISGPPLNHILKTDINPSSLESEAQDRMQSSIEKYQNFNKVTETNKTLKLLNLNDCLVSTSLLSYTINRKYINLLSLSLTYCSLDGDQVEELSRIFGSQTVCIGLESLNLSHNHVDDLAILHLTRVIEFGWGVSLRSLDLSGNIISDIGFIQVLNVIIPDYSSRSMLCTSKKRNKTSDFNLLEGKHRTQEPSGTTFLGLLSQLQYFRINGNCISSIGIKYLYNRIQGFSCLLPSEKENMDNSFDEKHSNCDTWRCEMATRLEGERMFYVEEKDFLDRMSEVSQTSKILRLKQLNLFEENPINREVIQNRKSCLYFDEHDSQRHQNNTSTDDTFVKGQFELSSCEDGLIHTNLLSLKLLEVAANKIDFEGLKDLHRIKLLFMEQSLIEKLNSIIAMKKSFNKNNTLFPSISHSLNGDRVREIVFANLDSQGKNFSSDKKSKRNSPLQEQKEYDHAYFWPRFQSLSTINMNYNKCCDVRNHRDEGLSDIEENWRAFMSSKYKGYFSTNEILEFTNKIQKDMEFFLLMQIII